MVILRTKKLRALRGSIQNSMQKGNFQFSGHILCETQFYLLMGREAMEKTKLLSSQSDLHLYNLHVYKKIITLQARDYKNFLMDKCQSTYNYFSSLKAVQRKINKLQLNNYMV